MSPFRIHIARSLLGTLMLVATARAGVGDRFSLESARTRVTYGPFVVQDGAHLAIEGRAYEIRTTAGQRIAFVDVGDGRVFGPLQLVEGRVVEIAGQMYTCLMVVPAGAARPHLPPLPRPPPRPAPIPLPSEAPPTPAAPPRPLLPSPADRLRIAFWAEPLSRTPLEWKVDGRRGSDTTLNRTSLGVTLGWSGFLVEAALSGNISSDDVVPPGLDVAEATLENGNGWRISGGYRQPFLREGSWEVFGGARLDYRQDRAELSSRSIVATPSTNSTSELRYESAASDVTLSEFACWLDAGLVYTQPGWGLYGSVSVLPFNNIDVSGVLPREGGDLTLSADRTQPLALAAGAWLSQDDWRFFIEFSAGAEERLRLGASFLF